MPKLSIQEGYRVTHEFTIPEGISVIGRAEGVALQIVDHAGISREHCKLTFHDKQVIIEDLASRNGTFVNSKPIQGPVILKHRDHIQLDDVLLIYLATDLATHDDTEIPKPQDDHTGRIAFVQETAQKLMQNISLVIQGKDDVIKQVIIALFCDGHVLLEDVPGVGKTKLAQALAKSVSTDFKRIQFTPDMLPNDITGVNVFNEQEHTFVFMPGPIFTNIVLADEINRGTPRIQSALLECMSESAVTVDGCSHILRKPFFVIATQNPIDFHGTYPLPEAQLDRFLMKLSMGYPDPDTEIAILAQQADSNPLVGLQPIIEASDLIRCQALVQTVKVSKPFRDYVVTIVNETRRHEAFLYGCSPRASLALMRAAQALAAISGRDYVLPRDARNLAIPILAHRLPLKLQGHAAWHSSEAVLKDILTSLPIEQWENMSSRLG